MPQRQRDQPVHQQGVSAARTTQSIRRPRGAASMGASALALAVLLLTMGGMAWVFQNHVNLAVEYLGQLWTPR